MCFDRYEIHIQAFRYLLMENQSSFNPHLRKIYFSNIYIYIYSIVHEKNENEKKKRKLMVPMTYNGSNIFDFLMSHIDINNIFQDDSILFLVLFKAFW